MLNRFSTALQSAVDALAPPPPLLEDFVYHWRRITNFYVKHEPVTKVVIENTNIPAHLEQLIKILVEDEGAVGETGAAGPCLEYLLQHRIPDLLVTLAGTDSPPGMKAVTLGFTCRLLTQLREPALPHVGVYTAVQKLVLMCNGMHASPTELDEIHFLCTLCAVVGRYPHLINLFNTRYVASRRVSLSSDCSSLGSGCDDDPKRGPVPPREDDLLVSPAHPAGEKPGTESALTTPPLSESQSPLWGEPEEFTLVDALLSFLHSADNRVTVKACEGLMSVAALPSDGFAQSLARSSVFCSELAARLATLYRSIPQGVDANDLDDIHVNWGLDSPLWSDGTKFAGCREVSAFLAWLDYCDQLVRESHPTTGRALARAVRALFLEDVLQTALLSGEDADLVFVTALVAKCLRQVTAEALLEEFMFWLVGESCDPELPDVHTCPLRKRLFDNCFHDQDEISLETLRLFEVMLEKPSQHALHCLVLTYVNSRGYYDTSSLDSVIGSWSDEEEERERNNRSSPTLDFSEGSSPVSRTLAPRNIDKVINSFLELVPRQLRSAGEEEGYEQYVQDADRQYRAAAARWAASGWPLEASFPEDCRPEADHEGRGPTFYEGPFLRMLFTRLVRLPYQPYEINLQLTSLVSRLALLPHPYLHEYLLNPLVPAAPDASSLHAALGLVGAELGARAPETGGSRAALRATRRRLLDGVGDPQDESSSILESVIVLEEFTKELAAIAFVKYHHSS
ncbi:FHF complex subunit HOOK interacting protein 2A-like [Bacillus rossius redtenbacheri]|uniref:FHF complex subunit HOOK interacting protein 2A-like n=1 Tax=Bacillus rossius redtenbacheri TaxID=93214 RepID=UPI002FDD588D